MAKVHRQVRRGQIWWVDWSPGRGSEQLGVRPALVVQTETANELDEYDLMIVVAISGSGFEEVPTHIQVKPSKSNGLQNKSYIKCEQIQTITRNRLTGFIGSLEHATLQHVNSAIRQVLDLES